MKKLATIMAVSATVAFTALTAAAPANAAPRRHPHHAKSYVQRPAGPGYYEGLYHYYIDRDDRASSPYNDF